MSIEEIKVKKVYSLIDQIYNKKRKVFIPGKSKVHYAGSFYGGDEVKAMVKTIFNGWFGLAWAGEELERKLTSFIGCKSSILTNSGSSASLLAMSSLVNKYFADRVPLGSEVITPACTFATTASSIVHAGLKPVFIDVDLGTYNVNPEVIEKAITKKTKILFLPHTLGNPNEMNKVMKIVKTYNLLLVEDNCDALGSSFGNKKTGSFGILGTSSFYPAHHITLAGEGGAVFVNDKRLERILLSLRNWGRGCWCTGVEKDPNGACGHRFDFNIDGVPIDHKYYFTNLGYNLKPVEIQAAMGIVQLGRYKKMMLKRKANFNFLNRILKKYEDFFVLPKSPKKADPVWFSYPITIKDRSPFTRKEITSYLENKNIETRTVFAGNITRQPAFYGVDYRVFGSLKNSDKVLSDTFFIGLWPGLGKEELSYTAEIFEEFIKRF